MGACHIRYAWNNNVLFQDSYGGFAEHSSARSSYDDLYGGFSFQGIDPHLRVHIYKRLVRGICTLVVGIYLYMGYSLGDNYAFAEKNAASS